MPVTIGQVLADLTGAAEPISATVDKLVFGDPGTEVQGIATAFCATQYVVEQAASLGANLLITHEGVFYSHQDTREPLLDDPVYLKKLKSISDSGIAIYRFHDYWHRRKPDGIMTGLLEALDWSSHVVEQSDTSSILTVPGMSVAETADVIKRKLGIPYVRVAGDPALMCRRIGILVGYRGGGTMAIPLYRQKNLDLIIAGEGPEWETPEYVRDAAFQGRSHALIMLGHAESEAPGMKYLAAELAARYPQIPSHFIAGAPVYQIM